MNAKDYKQYETGLNRALTLPKYYLSKWDQFELNATSLEGTQLEQAKRLYATLGHLTNDERIFLANKYRASYKKKHINSPNYKLDQTAADEQGMTKKEYVELRRGIEHKFFYYLQNYVDKRILS